MRYVQVIFSPTGGTRNVVDCLTNALTNEWIDLDLCNNNKSYERYTFSAEDIVLFGVPSFAGHAPQTALERIGALQGNGAKAILVCVYGNRAYDHTLAELQHIVRNAGFQDVAAVAAIAEHSIARQVAAGRPDENDKVKLVDFAKKIKEKLYSDDKRASIVPGEVAAQQPKSGAVLIPQKTEACVACKLCVALCPTKAIDAVTLEADALKCISCMKCVAVCPIHDRRLMMEIHSLGGVSVSELCSRRNECELFL